MAKFIWTLKEQNRLPMIIQKITEDIKNKAKLDVCKLCLTENHGIINFPNHGLVYLLENLTFQYLMFIIRYSSGQ